MTQPISEVIESLDKNIKNLEGAEEINMHDVKTLLIDLFGTIRDLWELFEDVFKKLKLIKNLDEATKKGEELGETIENKKIAQEIKNLYL